MSKTARSLIVCFCILLVAPILFVFVCALILFLAPGTEIFGIRYVANGLSICNYEHQLYEIADSNTFDGDIRIKTYGVPITIEYTAQYNTHISFHQNYIGLTRSKFDEASIDVQVINESGKSNDLVIETHEIVPWVYQYKTDESYSLILTLPMSMAKRSLYIDSDCSPVTISGGANYANFEVVTTEQLNIENSITAEHFKYHTSKSIVLDNAKIYCDSADLKSTASTITVQYPLVGDLWLNTSGGDMRFVSCQNLDLTTQSGSLRGYGSENPTVREDVTISSRSGSINLGAIGTEKANALANITSVDGSINISSMVNGVITSERGRINISSADNLLIRDNLGNIDIGKVQTEVVIYGRNGKVNLGKLGDVSNPHVETTTGIIDAANTTGRVYLSCSANDLTLANKSSEDITILSGGKLNATGLIGKVTAAANGNVELKFVNVTGDVYLKTRNKCKTVNIDATCVSYTTINYELTSSRGNMQRLYQGDTLVSENTRLISNKVEGLVTIRVENTYGECSLYTKKLA